MAHSPGRPSLIVKLKLRRPSLLVKLPHAQSITRRRTSADSTTAPGAEEATSGSKLEGQVLILKVPTIPQTSTSLPPTNMPRTEPPVLDPKLFGRERSTRKRTMTPTNTGTMYSDPPAKKRKPDADSIMGTPATSGSLKATATQTLLQINSNSVTDVPATPQSPNVPASASLTPNGDIAMSARRSGSVGVLAAAAPLTPPSEGSNPSQSVTSSMAYMTLLPAPSYSDQHGNVRPLRDPLYDQRYVKMVISELECTTEQKRVTVHRRSARRILDLLHRASYPSTDEAKFLSKDEARAEVAPGSFFNGPIITAHQQPLPLSNVSDFLGEYYDNAATVHIQDSSASTGKTATWARSVTMKQVKERFQQRNMTPEHCPWNMLELATHHDDGLRPEFLNNEDCRLITKLKIPNLSDETRRRKYEPGFKEVEKWALLAEAGALTEPHQDSHGYSTFITINEGCVGFGWLSHPTEKERIAWTKDPQHFRDGRWRYVVLKPGQTIFFPAGTVHMVFRLKAAGNSLAFGGHILRCSNIVHWVTTLLEEHTNQNIVNEDLGDAAVGYLERVDRFVTQAWQQGTEDKWGGRDSLKEFQRLKKLFVSLPKPKASLPRKSSTKRITKRR